MDWQEAEREYTDEVIAETTIPVMFENSADRNSDRPAQRYKGGIYDRSLTETILPPAPDGDYRAIDYAEMRDVVRNLAAGFRDLGVEAGDRVGIFCDTRMEWAQSDFALLAAGAVVTTVYTSSTPEKAGYLLSDPGASGVVVENEELLERVLAVEDRLDLEFIVVVDRLDGAYADRDDVRTLADVHDRGAEVFRPGEYRSWLENRDMDDLASLIYTSGTTGRPKGVRLTHRNFRSNLNQLRKRYGPRPDRGSDVPTIDENTRSVSYLPLAHVYERVGGHFLAFAGGASVAYAESADTLSEDFQAVEPIAATSVPRVYEKMYDAIRAEASDSALSERIFGWATDVSRTYHERAAPSLTLRVQRWLADKLVFRSVRSALGGEVELLISAGGTLSADLAALYHGMGLPIYEGYGLTEAAPAVTSNPPEDPKIGTIGPPLAGVDVRVDTSVMPSGSFDDALGETGELLVSGPNVTDGYWNMPEETASAFEEVADGDGGTRRWFRTGDIVTLRPDGYLVFREREKQMLVLSTGKNVAPAPIEDSFASSSVVEQCMVVGDDEKFVSALVVPNVEGLREWAAHEGIDLPADRAALLEDDRVRERVEAEIDRVNERFEPHETIKRFRLVPEEFTEENELLTPTMKKKRRDIVEEYDHLVSELYGEDVEAATEAAEAE